MFTTWSCPVCLFVSVNCFPSFLYPLPRNEHIQVFCEVTWISSRQKLNSGIHYIFVNLGFSLWQCLPTRNLWSSAQLSIRITVLQSLHLKIFPANQCPARWSINSYFPSLLHNFLKVAEDITGQKNVKNFPSIQNRNRWRHFIGT